MPCMEKDADVLINSVDLSQTIQTQSGPSCLNNNVVSQPDVKYSNEFCVNHRQFLLNNVRSLCCANAPNNFSAKTFPELIL